MKVVTAVESIEKSNEDVIAFLAGGITNCPNWQNEVLEKFDRMYNHETENFIIANPRRENFPIDDPKASDEQIAWEYKLLESADIFSMYFCTGDIIQPICLYELGRNIVRIQNRFPNDWENRIVISVEKGYCREADVDIQVKLATNGKIYINKGDHDSLIREHVNMIYRSFVKVNISKND